MTQIDLARRFHALHAPGPLVLINVWDAGSARVAEEAGAAAVATTSAGVAWSHGVRDGESLSFEVLLETVRRIVRVVRVPVTVDIERGYGDGSPDAVARAVEAVVDAGAVGINLEDGTGRADAPLFSPEAQAARIAAARAAARGVDLFVNVRTDVFLAGVGEPEGRADEVVRRAQAYLAAGASGVFVPGVTDAETIRRLARAIAGPLNVLARPGALSVPALAALGVARVSLGPTVALAALALVRRTTEEALASGTYDALAAVLGDGFASADVQVLFEA